MLPIHECFYSMGTQNNSWKDKKNNFVFVPTDWYKINLTCPLKNWQIKSFVLKKNVLLTNNNSHS